MDAIIYLITFRYVWDRPEQASWTPNAPAAGTVIWQTLTATSYADAMGAAKGIMEGLEDDPAGFVTSVYVERKKADGTVMRRLAMARRDRVVGCACGEHVVWSRQGRWATGGDSALSEDICAKMGQAN